MTTDDATAAHDANAAFYVAFEARDLDAMSDCWERSDRAAVVHPGWPPQHGWARVLTTWDAIFSGPEPLHCIVTDERVEVMGHVAVVTCEEQLLQGLHGDSTADELASARVAATNVFVRDGADWKMILHHGSPVYPDDPRV
ncbi:MAG: nuclear transport factor 2 family protein [Acidimicrobiia bacterium]